MYGVSQQNKSFVHDAATLSFIHLERPPWFGFSRVPSYYDPKFLWWNENGGLVGGEGAAKKARSHGSPFNENKWSQFKSTKHKFSGSLAIVSWAQPSQPIWTHPKKWFEGCGLRILCLSILVMVESRMSSSSYLLVFSALVISIFGCLLEKCIKLAVFFR